MSLRYSAEVVIGLSVLPAIQSFKLVQSTARLGLRSLQAIACIASTILAFIGIDSDAEDVYMDSVIDLTSLPSFPSSENRFGSFQTPSPNGSVVAWSHVDWSAPPGLVSDRGTSSFRSDGRPGGSAAGSILRYRTGPLSSTPVPWRRPGPGPYRDAIDSPIMPMSSPSTTDSSRIESSEESIYVSFGSSPVRRLFQPASSPSSWFSDHSVTPAAPPQSHSESQQICENPPPWKRYQVASLYRVHAGAVETERTVTTSVASPLVMNLPHQSLSAGSRGPPPTDQVSRTPAVHVAPAQPPSANPREAAPIAQASRTLAVPSARILTDASAHNRPATSQRQFVSHKSLNPHVKPYLPPHLTTANTIQRHHEAPVGGVLMKVMPSAPLHPQVVAKNVGAVILQGNDAIDPTIPTRQSLAATDNSTKFIITRRPVDSTCPPPASWAQVAAKLPPKPNSEVIGTAVALSARPARSVSSASSSSVLALASNKQEQPPDARWDEEVSMITSEKERSHGVIVSIPHLEAEKQPKVVKTAKQLPRTRRTGRPERPSATKCP